jgi:hypothetical protein
MKKSFKDSEEDFGQVERMGRRVGGVIEQASA